MTGELLKTELQTIHFQMEMIWLMKFKLMQIPMKIHLSLKLTIKQQITQIKQAIAIVMLLMK